MHESNYVEAVSVVACSLYLQAASKEPKFKFERCRKTAMCKIISTNPNTSDVVFVHFWSFKEAHYMVQENFAFFTFIFNNFLR